MAACWHEASTGSSKEVEKTQLKLQFLFSTLHGHAPYNAHDDLLAMKHVPRPRYARHSKSRGKQTLLVLAQPTYQIQKLVLLLHSTKVSGGREKSVGWWHHLYPSRYLNCSHSRRAVWHVCTRRWVIPCHHVSEAPPRHPSTSAHEVESRSEGAACVAGHQDAREYWLAGRLAWLAVWTPDQRAYHPAYWHVHGSACLDLAQYSLKQRQQQLMEMTGLSCPGLVASASAMAATQPLAKPAHTQKNLKFITFLIPILKCKGDSHWSIQHCTKTTHSLFISMNVLIPSEYSRKGTRDDCREDTGKENMCPSIRPRTPLLHKPWATN